MNKSYKLLIATTGSVASIKLPILIKSLVELSVLNKKYAYEIHLILTANAKRFCDMSELPKEVQVYDDRTLWSIWHHKGDPVLHVELSRLADMMVIVPINCNTMAKIANGMCDNLVTCTARSWDISKPLLFCPATNTKMWKHPITLQHIATLKQWGYIEVPPIVKTLMCGDCGIGGMAEIQTILNAIVNITNKITL